MTAPRWRHPRRRIFRRAPLGRPGRAPGRGGLSYAPRGEPSTVRTSGKCPADERVARCDLEDVLIERSAEKTSAGCRTLSLRRSLTGRRHSGQVPGGVTCPTDRTEAQKWRHLGRALRRKDRAAGHTRSKREAAEGSERAWKKVECDAHHEMRTHIFAASLSVLCRSCPGQKRFSIRRSLTRICCLGTPVAAAPMALSSGPIPGGRQPTSPHRPQLDSTSKTLAKTERASLISVTVEAIATLGTVP